MYIISTLQEATQKKIKESEAESRTYSVLDIFRTPRLRRNALLLIVIWMAISLVFDGHVRNVGSLGLDIFLTFTIATATEFPADTFLTIVLDRWVNFDSFFLNIFRILDRLRSQFDIPLYIIWCTIYYLIFCNMTSF